jgi:hypothetical protein
MRRSFPLHVLTLLALLAPLGVARLEAQGPGPATTGQPGRDERTRPFRGLFGSGGNPESTHHLTLNGSIFGGYDGNILADQAGGGGGLGTSGEATDGALAGGSLGLQYGRRGRHVDVGATLDSSVRYFPSNEDLTSSAYSAGFGMSAELSRRTRLELSTSVAYQPYYQLSSLFPIVGDPVLGGPPPSNLDLVVSHASGWIYGASAQIGRQLGRRSTLQAFYTMSRSEYDNDPLSGEPIYDLDAQGAGFRFIRGLTRYASLRLGYAYRYGSYGGGPGTDDVRGHDIDLGVDYARALSFSRRTSFSFSTGSSITETFGVRHFNIVGSAGLRHEIGRTWLAHLAYNRGVGFIGSFAEPVLNDSVGAGLTGLLGRRWSLSFASGYTSGRVGLGGGDGAPSRFSTTTGSATVQYAFTAMLAAFTQYSYFYYDFPASSALPLVGRQDRHSVRVGLSLSLPLLR